MEYRVDPKLALRFGLYEVDLLQGVLSRQGVRLKIQEQPFRILALLLQAAPCLAGPKMAGNITNDPEAKSPPTSATRQTPATAASPAARLVTSRNIADKAELNLQLAGGPRHFPAPRRSLPVPAWS